MVELGISRVAPEVRAGDAGYTDLLIQAALSRAGGENITSAALGAPQVAAGIVSRALAVATADGDRGLLTPDCLASIGYDLVYSGQSVALFEVDAFGGLSLLRADPVEPVSTGGPDPRSWVYTLTLAGPGKTRTLTSPSASVFHVRWNAHPLRPWRGRSPLAVAAASGQLAARLSQSLSDEASVAVSRIFAQPQGTGQGVVNALREAIRDPKQGRIALPETTKSGGGAGMSSAPTRDWRAERLGFDAPDPAVNLHALMLAELGAACGVPWALMPGSNANGPALREAQRELLTGTVEPIGQLVAAELGRVLEGRVELHHHRLAAADVAARARAVHLLVEKAGVARDDALRLVGWS